MAFPFGQDIQYWFYPLIDDASPVTVLTSQTPAIYVYDSQPGRTDAASGAGSPVATITSWSWDSNRKGWYFTIPAIDDPDPTGGLTQRDYWIAINFRLQASEQLQLVMKELELERVSAHFKTVVVTQNDLRNYYPQVDAYSTESQRTAYIAQALEEVKSRLRAKGYEWSRIHRADRLVIAVTLKTLAMIMLAQLQQSGDKFALKYQEFKKMYEDTLESLRFEYDADNDGEDDAEASVGGMILIER